MNSASISRHGMLPLVGCLNIEVSVRWWLRFKSPWYYETVPLGQGALHARRTGADLSRLAPSGMAGVREATIA